MSLTGSRDEETTAEYAAKSVMIYFRFSSFAATKDVYITCVVLAMKGTKSPARTLRKALGVPKLPARTEERIGAIPPPVLESVCDIGRAAVRKIAESSALADLKTAYFADVCAAIKKVHAPSERWSNAKKAAAYLAVFMNDECKSDILPAFRTPFGHLSTAVKFSRRLVCEALQTFL